MRERQTERVSDLEGTCEKIWNGNDCAIVRSEVTVCEPESAVSVRKHERRRKRSVWLVAEV